MKTSKRVRDTAENFDQLAHSVSQLATFLSAGLDALGSLRVLDHPPEPFARAAECTGAHDVPEALANASLNAETSVRPAWGYLAACWALATSVGAALAGTLERVSAVLHSLAALPFCH